MTINQCDGNGTPMLTDIKVCTTELCGAEYTKKMSTVWLDETLKPTAKRLAIYFIQSPLPYDEEKNNGKSPDGISHQLIISLQLNRLHLKDIQTQITSPILNLFLHLNPGLKVER